jgi:hypothetical protein
LKKRLLGWLTRPKKQQPEITNEQTKNQIGKGREKQKTKGGRGGGNYKIS